MTLRVLTYHRVASPDLPCTLNPCTVSASPDLFTKQWDRLHQAFAGTERPQVVVAGVTLPLATPAVSMVALLLTRLFSVVLYPHWERWPT